MTETIIHFLGPAHWGYSFEFGINKRNNEYYTDHGTKLNTDEVEDYLKNVDIWVKDVTCRPNDQYFRHRICDAPPPWKLTYKGVTYDYSYEPKQFDLIYMGLFKLCIDDFTVVPTVIFQDNVYQNHLDKRDFLLQYSDEHGYTKFMLFKHNNTVFCIMNSTIYIVDDDLFECIKIEAKKLQSDQAMQQVTKKEELPECMQNMFNLIWNNLDRNKWVVIYKDEIYATSKNKKYLK